MKTALIFGVGGQDGSYLADLLLEKNYDVHGTVRRSSGGNLGRILHCVDRVRLHRCDLTDSASINRVLHEVAPDEVYNEADQDNVGWSKDCPLQSVDVTAGGPARILEALRTLPNRDRVRLFQPVSATMFGCPTSGPQDESTPLDPQSPYACAKSHAYHLGRYYRREYGLYVSTGIMYNHDSPRRGPGYLLQDLCRQASGMHDQVDWSLIPHGAKIPFSNFTVGDPDAVVDVGFAGDYVDAAWRILQLDEPDDFVISTGRPNKVGVIAEKVLRRYGLEGVDVVADPEWSKSLNQGLLFGDYGKLYRKTGWEPKTRVVELIKMIREGIDARP